MKIGIISARDGDYHPNRRLMEAIRARGYDGVLLNPYEVWPALIGGRLCTVGRRSHADVVIPRQGAEIGDSSLALIEQLWRSGIPVINGPGAIRLARNKFRCAQVLAASGLPVPDTVLLNAVSGLSEAAKQVGGFPVVIKKVSSRQGQGTFLAADLQAAREWFQEERQRTGILVQRFIDPAGRQDLRVLVMGARAAAAVSLQPAAGDFRANFHLTGSVRPMEIDPRLASLAVKATAALGLQIAGVDLMVDGRGQSVVVEANYSPGFQGLEAATGADIAGQMIDFAASVVREGKEKHRP